MKLYFQSYYEHAIYQESVLANSCLEHGAEILIKTIPCSRDMNNYYTAFFNLSIGIERFLKIMIVQFEYFNNDEIISDDCRKKIFAHGHNLIALYNEMAMRINISKVDGNHKTYKLLLLLTDFAKGDRYYYLNILTSNKKPKEDFLSRWNTLCSEHFTNLVNIEDNSNEEGDYSIFENDKNRRILNEDIIKISLETKKNVPCMIQEIKDILYPILHYMKYHYFKNKEGIVEPYIDFNGIFNFFNKVVSD